MRTLTNVLVTAALVLLATAAAAGQQDAAQARPPVIKTAKLATPGAESMLDAPYVLTWQKDARFKRREPFKTVLRSVGPSAKKVRKFELPRTPSEESAFTVKATSYIEEASAALEEADFTAAEEKITTVTKMVAVKLVTKTAKDRMVEVGAELAKVAKRLASMRARASLKQAFELAARMQAYFDNDRHGNVISLHKEIMELDNPRGLKNPEVAATAVKLLKQVGELSRRAQVHLDFAQMELKIDAVSHFPQGRSFAIVNGEVVGEGGKVAPELTMASVAGKTVIFNYKGERIALELAQ